MIQIQPLVTQIDGHTSMTIVASAKGWPIGQARVQDVFRNPLLLDLFVEGSRRRTGVGRRIVEYAITRTAASASPLAVYYLPDSPARHLLELLGFVDEGIRGIEGMSPDYIWATLRRAPVGRAG